MISKTDIIEIIYQSIEEINRQERIEIPKNPQSQLFGRGSRLDSLGLVNLIVSVEEKINDKFGISISLADEKAMSQKNSPFLSVDSLAEYILQIIKESGVSINSF
jgi:D-alanine--poly(phosphoribitol) ligase subunit 2